MKAFITDYVKTSVHNHIGRVCAKHHNFSSTSETLSWFEGQKPAKSKETLNEAWYSILCHEGGSVLVPESELIEVSTTPIGGTFTNSWSDHYFREEEIKEEETPITKSVIENLQRIDITGINNGEFIALQEDREEDGQYVRWEEIEKILIDHV